MGKHYLKFRDGSYWSKGGADSHEDFLAYHGFEKPSREIKGGEPVELGPPPGEVSEDWVVLVTRLEE